MDTVRIQKRKIPEHLLKYFRLKKQNRWILRNTIIWHKSNYMPSSVKDRFTNSYEPVFMLVKSKRYYFDLDAVREKVKYPEDVARRIRQDKEAGVKPFQKGTDVARHTKIPQLQAESFGSPRAREWRPEKYGVEDISGARRGRIVPSESVYQKNGLGKNPGDVWRESTQPFRGAHFATFPEKLLIKPIKAGCPPKGIVLDPFSGAATTGLVALKLNRNYIGIELNPDYCKLAKKRIEKEIGTLFQKIEIKK